jgi:hypothetical protein
VICRRRYHSLHATTRLASGQGQASSFTPVHASLRFQSSSASAGSIA